MFNPIDVAVNVILVISALTIIFTAVAEAQPTDIWYGCETPEYVLKFDPYVIWNGPHAYTLTSPAPESEILELYATCSDTSTIRWSYPDERIDGTPLDPADISHTALYIIDAHHEIHRVLTVELEYEHTGFIPIAVAAAIVLHDGTVGVFSYTSFEERTE